MVTTLSEAVSDFYVGVTAKGLAAAPLGVRGRGPMGVRLAVCRVRSTGKVILGLGVVTVIMVPCVEVRGH